MSLITLHPTKQYLAYFQYNGRQQLIFYKHTGVKKEILQRAFEQLDNLLSYYSKVTVVLLQLHQRDFTTDNKSLTLFLNSLKKHLKIRYNSQIGYIWVREQLGAQGQHYHIAIMINGHKCCNSYSIDKITKELWLSLCGENFSYRIKNRTYRVECYKGDKELRAVRMRISYMAKKDGKQLGRTVKCYGASRHLHHSYS